MRIRFAARLLPTAVLCALAGGGPARAAPGPQVQVQPTPIARHAPTATPRTVAPALESRMVAPPGPTLIRAGQPLTMTGMGNRPLTTPTPAPPLVIRAAAALTMTGLGDRPLTTPTPAPPLVIRAPEALVMTGVH